MLFGGGRVPKHHIRIEAYGTVDELNSWIGLIRGCDIKPEHKNVLKATQDRLFTLGSMLATNPEKRNVKTPELQEKHVQELEIEIDRLQELLPELKNFILPGGEQVIGYTHVARCVCRRAERNATYLAEKEGVEEIIIQYLNRLSDYLFVLARKLAQDLNSQETIWQADLS